MNIAAHRHWLHFDLVTNIAHVLDLSHADTDPSNVTGLVFPMVAWPEDFIADALDMSHGDGSAVLMGVEMRGNLTAWFEVEPDRFADILARGELASIHGEPITGARRDDDGRTWTVTGADVAPLELTSRLA